jgi:hypothetical protein
MQSPELELVSQDEGRSKPRSSRSGAFGRALGEVEPRQLSQSDLAYLRFILLALHSSMKEVRHSVGNRALIIDACVGMDLLIENAERRFGFPLISPEHEAIPEAPREHLVDELTLEAAPSQPAGSPRSETSSNAQFTRHEQQTV